VTSIMTQAYEDSVWYGVTICIYCDGSFRIDDMNDMNGILGDGAMRQFELNTRAGGL
jgi:hypothetical protein